MLCSGLVVYGELLDMPDGDRMPRGSHPLYKEVLQQVYENQDAESIAIAVIRRIKQDIKKSGQGGNLLIAQALPSLSLISGNSLLREMNINWDEQHDIIHTIEKNATGDPFHVQQAAEACRQLLIRSESGEIIENVKSELEKERMLAIYKARIEEAPMDSYFKNTDYEKHKELYEAVPQYIIREYENDFVNMKPGSMNDLLEIDITKV